MLAVVSISCALLAGCNNKPQPPSQEPQKQEMNQAIPSGFKAVESEGRDEKTGLWKEIEHVKSGMRLRLIPAGEFDMGFATGNPDEQPVHHVKISAPFYMGMYEVTQAQWKAVMGTRRNPSLWKGDALPLEQVSWEDARDFCVEAGDGLRLPSEAEWEYACRAGSTTQWFFGDDAGKLGDYAWFNENSEIATHEVGLKKPNAWGLYDMAGNVAEWCEDGYYASYIGALADGSANLTGKEEFRVRRGGSWDDPAANMRSAARASSLPMGGDIVIGFRCAFVPGAAPPK
jgi:formylglycine-generating enzyme required for sulfatase activity